MAKRVISSRLYRLSTRVMTSAEALTREDCIALRDAMVAEGLKGYSCEGDLDDVVLRTQVANDVVHRLATTDGREARRTGEGLYAQDRYHWIVSRSLKHVPMGGPDNCIDGDTATYRKRFYLRRGGEWIDLGLDEEVWRAYSEEHGYCAGVVIVRDDPAKADPEHELAKAQGQAAKRAEDLAVALRELEVERANVAALEAQVEALTKMAAKWQDGAVALAGATTDDARAQAWRRLCDFDPLDPTTYTAPQEQP
jgi:hypothetical protein